MTRRSLNDDAAQRPIFAYHLKIYRYRFGYRDLRNSWISEPVWLKRILVRGFSLFSGVKSRRITDPFIEEVWLFLIPVFHGLKGWDVAQSLLGGYVGYRPGRSV